VSQILIVDDDPQLRSSFERLLSAEGHQVQTAVSGESAVRQVGRSVPDLVIMDVRLPGMTGLEAYREMQQLEPKLPVIIMTAYGTTDTAIEATKLGAYDYVLKPFEIPRVLELIDQALQAGRFMRTRVRVGSASGSATEPDALIGRGAAMQEVYKAIGRVAPTDATVLIRGESGTGKELVARAIYHHSMRAERPFLVINCVAIPETLLESELFGYEKGAFTGAVSRRVGKVEQAHHGTLFLDEIGDMPINIQAKVLRLLQERSIERLGGRNPIPVDVRLIAATNRDLEAALADGRFREDLYYRLNVVTLRLPSLRERAGDLGLLADYFLNRFAADLKSDDPGLAPDALELIHRHPWPGNVRELANVLQRTLIFNRGGPIHGEDLDQALGLGNGLGGDQGPDLEERALELLAKWVQRQLTRPGNDRLFDGLMDRLGAVVVQQALQATGGNRSRAAVLLGMSRPTLLAKIDKFGIKVETAVHRGT